MPVLQCAVHPSAMAEIERLAGRGFDVSICDTLDPQGLDPASQAEADRTVTALEADVRLGREAFLSSPTVQVWSKLVMRAIALHALYGAGWMPTLGHGISPDAYDQPLFPLGDNRLVSARQVLQAVRPMAVERVIGKYQAFIGTEFDAGTRLLFRGAKDGASIRTRAIAATELALRHIERSGLPGRGLRSASIACGAAGPVYALVNDLEVNLGVQFEEILLVDLDPMALATARSLGRQAGVADRIRLELRDLREGSFRDYIGPSDIVDMLGIIEYMDDEQSVELLQGAREVLAPGGLLLFGNMLPNRPQQAFFADIVRWPRLYQRSITRMLELMRRAGLNPGRASVRVPPEGVYAVYAATP